HEVDERKSVDFDVIDETKRSNSYDAQGRLVAYHESTTGSASSDMTATTDDQMTGFDDYGRVTSLQVTIHETGTLPNGDSWNVETHRTRSNITFTGFKLLHSYTDRLQNLATGVTETTTRTASTYNPLNQLSGYNESTATAIPGAGTVTTTTGRDHMTYDANGNLSGYHEIHPSDDQP